MSTEEPRRHATLRRENQVTLPPEITRALQVQECDEIEFSVTPAGGVVLRGLTVIPSDQRWFWTEEWQRGEREADTQLRAGEGETFRNPEDMFGDMEGER
ncbi:AbrB/MazE/SpoVT family DNA-binding domain-containing protein [Nocardiopsis tropica]|uniref:AbrB/MazE/SpoVT family DNA-binding domain-containing protein n=1 Tax=Nocardiopsis tropica TaxID=109330 RepID=A0ABU7KJ80_9ACTN|nr:AbrB/MazE/SpoVT family DNA-binding domain-containing protein [Nocardiopsis umidischolae]MEE2049354.1 AbrB/MazE/SpoVT family DNA-binding domain-containing protein [Nocardiopsis umidischolae]